jgi:hypothetical protein
LLPTSRSLQTAGNSQRSRQRSALNSPLAISTSLEGKHLLHGEMKVQVQTLSQDFFPGEIELVA